MLRRTMGESPVLDAHCRGVLGIGDQLDDLRVAEAKERVAILLLLVLPHARGRNGVHNREHVLPSGGWVRLVEGCLVAVSAGHAK